jgi:hypothetical protein
MKRTLLMAAVVLLLARAEMFDAAAQAVDLKVVHAFLAENKEDKPATTFFDDVAKIWLVWKGEGLRAGDEIRLVWIAEDVGSVAPLESKIGERSLTVSKPNEDGALWLSRPRDRLWPIGHYRTEIYVGKRLVQALRFTIQPGVSVEVH